MSYPTVERSATDTTPIFFSWGSVADINSFVAINEATEFAATAGEVQFVRSEGVRFIYKLTYAVADRPTEAGVARYRFTDGTIEQFLTLSVSSCEPEPSVVQFVPSQLDIATFASEPKQVTVDGETVIQHSIADLIAADKYLTSKQANGKANRGLMFTKIVSGGAV